jgi:hypothetical protein
MNARERAVLVARAVVILLKIFFLDIVVMLLRE